jgi:hypothetical protein
MLAMDTSSADDFRPEDAVSVPMVTTHMARFEFSKQGTKILMIEWDPSELTEANVAAAPAVNRSSQALITGGWHIWWPGKPDKLSPVIEAEDERIRLYLLLGVKDSMPGTVTVGRPSGPNIEVKPLPAIFPEGFDVEAGPRGVLHTIWAKKRVAELDREMDAELRANAESVGLEIALAEKQAIQDHFMPRAPVLAVSPIATSPSGRNYPPSPIGGRMGEKLKGLRLATGAADLVPSPTAGSFSEAAKSLPPPKGANAAVSTFTSISPEKTGPATSSSLDAILKGDVFAGRNNSQDTEDDLFALPMSPRSPDMKKSPFSLL